MFPQLARALPMRVLRVEGRTTAQNEVRDDSPMSFVAEFMRPIVSPSVASMFTDHLAAPRDAQLPAIARKV